MKKIPIIINPAAGEKENIPPELLDDQDLELYQLTGRKQGEAYDLAKKQYPFERQRSDNFTEEGTPFRKNRHGPRQWLPLSHPGEHGTFFGHGYRDRSPLEREMGPAGIWADRIPDPGKGGGKLDKSDISSLLRVSGSILLQKDSAVLKHWKAKKVTIRLAAGASWLCDDVEEQANDLRITVDPASLTVVVPVK